jgi:PAS domain S-box-containing protein
MSGPVPPESIVSASAVASKLVPRPVNLSTQLESIGASLDDAFEALGLPAWLIDANGSILWLNRAALELAGDRRSGHYIATIAPESRHQAQTLFSRKLLGVDVATESLVTVTGPNGERVLLESNGVALRSGGKVVGVFGVGKIVGETQEAGSVTLAPRLHETLRLLADGKSTDAIAAALGVTRESARNYVRLLLKALDAHSRVEAVARGRELGLL